jgi:hypothetical protein
MNPGDKQNQMPYLVEIVEKMDGKLDACRLWQEGHAEREKAQDEKIADYKLVLFGNGRPGLVKDVETLKNAAGRKEMNTLARWALGVLGTVVGYGILGILGWLLFIYRSHP